MGHRHSKTYITFISLDAVCDISMVNRNKIYWLLSHIVKSLTIDT